MLKENLQAGKISFLEDATYQYQIYDSVLQIKAGEWNRLIDSSKDLAMDQRLIGLMEATLANQAQFWTVAFHDAHSQLIACANLCLFYTDIVQSTSPFLQKCVNQLRSIWPNALKWKILFCGLPVPSGHSHLRFSSQVDPKSLLVLLNQIMRNLAQQQGAQVIVFKEFNTEQAQQIDSLTELGFYRGELAPLFILPGLFKNFPDYLAALRSPYRHQIQAGIKKFASSNLWVEHIFDPEEIRARFTDEVYELYLNVWRRAKEKLECFPIEFFRNLPLTMPAQVAFTLISDDGKPVAFTIGLVGDEIFYNLYTGLDYALNEKVDLYFNLFYQDLDCAFRYQKKQIFLGQTSESFKSRLGATPDARFFFVRALHPVIKLFFRLFHRFIFPKIQHPPRHRVFK